MFGSVSAQENNQPKILLDVKPDTFFTQIDSFSNPIQLPHKFIIPSSEKIYLKNFKLLFGIHYNMDYNKGEITLLQNFNRNDSLKIIYQHYPFPIIDEYYHREVQEMLPSDTLGKSKTDTVREIRTNFLEDIDTYQSNLEKSGSISRGFEIGTNKDLSLNSGLNLQLSGSITPQVGLVAALTDESTPIQPEGNTQTLREVDKVFVKITSPYIGGTLGDFNLEYLQSRYGNMKRKLQGITIENPYKSSLQQITYGTSRGTFHTNKFLGQEGKQGPYQLIDKNGSKDIIVLAGTERVYVDGEEQVRGENNDYVIDYGLAQITFTNKKLVTSENRIEVDFEYASNFQRYGKNFFGASTRAENLTGRMHYDFRFFREWDDTNNLLEDSAPLSNAEKSALENAGDNPLKAAVNGARFIGEGEGTYKLVLDTLINQTVYDSVYSYVGSGNGDYSVTFTNVGSGNGTYQRKRLGVYNFVGDDRGDYLPIRLVPLAGDKKFYDMGMEIQLTKKFNINGEIGISNFDQNVFSSLNDDENTSNAFQISSNYQDSSFSILGKSLGKAAVGVQWNRQNKAFAPLDRQFNPEYNYKWNLPTTTLNEREESIETNIFYQPKSYLKLQGNWGKVDRGTNISSNRSNGQIILQHRALPEINAGLEYISSNQVYSKSDWWRQNFLAYQKFGVLKPQFTFKREDRSVKDSQGRVTGFVFNDFAGSLNIQKLWGVNWNLRNQYRTDYLYDPHQPDAKLKQAITQTYGLEGEILSAKKWQGRFSFVYRNKDYTSFFEQVPRDSIPIYQSDAQFQDTSWNDQQSHLGNFELQYRSEGGEFVSKWNYKVASELQAIDEKVYVDVGENNGNYVFDETLQEYVPDPQGKFILFILPTGDFESITNIETGWQIQYRPKVGKKSNGTMKKILDNISSLTYFKIEEESREKNVWQLYFLNLEKFHNVNSTLRGTYIINQDLYLFERNPDWGLQFRSRYRDNLTNQFLDAVNNESRIIWDRSAQVRKQLFGRKLNMTLEYKNGLNKRRVSSLSTRNQNILRQALTTGFDFRPEYEWRFQLDLEGGLEKNRDENNLMEISYLDIRPQVSYAIRGKARATANLSNLLVNILDNPFSRPIPFEMAKGKKNGTSWLWNARFEYFISTNVTITANYTGRKDAGTDRVIHLGKAEVRAFF